MSRLKSVLHVLSYLDATPPPVRELLLTSLLADGAVEVPLVELGELLGESPHAKNRSNAEKRAVLFII